MWPDRRILELFGIEHPLVQAPMAGANDAELAIAVSEAGGLGSLPCAMLTADGVRTGIETIRARTNRAFNVNFFCHAVPRPDAQAADRWRQRLSAYYEELGVDPAEAAGTALRMPFDDAMCDVVAELAPPARRSARRICCALSRRSRSCIASSLSARGTTPPCSPTCSPAGRHAAS